MKQRYPYLFVAIGLLLCSSVAVDRVNTQMAVLIDVTANILKEDQ